ncbi:MAG: lactate racemase domain-containing protein [Deltaproteobacteria bacterium]|nr:lactate racemase domain-containing protein [Deltaproteobacteria bacterium]
MVDDFNTLETYRDHISVAPIPRIKRLRDREVSRRVACSLKGFLGSLTRKIRATVCVTDNTRPFPEKKILPLILDIMEDSGVKRGNITIVVATGLHRHLTKDELISKFGRYVFKNYNIIQNDPHESVGIRKKLYVNRALCESDFIVGLGVFEPHQYAGFSGGNKIFIIGCGGRQTIDYTHSPKMILRRGVRLGNTTNNPFRNFIENSANYLPPRWILNVVLNDDGDIICFSSGEPSEVFNSLYEWYKENLVFSFKERFDAAFVVLDRHKGVNLYQASRGATYLALSRSPIIKKGSPIIISAKLEEGFGTGDGEKEFQRILLSNIRNSELLERLKREDIRGGGQRAVMLLYTLLNHPVIFTGFKRDIKFQRENIYFIPVISDAVRKVISDFGCRKIVYVKNPFLGLFCFSEGKKGEN